MLCWIKTLRLCQWSLGITESFVSVQQNYSSLRSYITEERRYQKFVEQGTGTVEFCSERYVKCRVILTTEKRSLLLARSLWLLRMVVKSGEGAEGFVSSFSAWNSRTNCTMWMPSCSTFMGDGVHMTRWTVLFIVLEVRGPEIEWDLGNRPVWKHWIDIKELWIWCAPISKLTCSISVCTSLSNGSILMASLQRKVMELPRVEI